MKRTWLRALILGAVIGPAGTSAEPAAEVDDPATDESVGHVVAGLGFHVWEEDAREAAEWAAELVQAGGETLEAARWRRIAAKSAVLPPILNDDLDTELAARSGPAAGDGSLSPLGCMLCLLPSLDRTALISSWATSTEEPTRRALARALGAPFEAVGVRGAIEHLQGDPSAEVRRLARSAAVSRSAPLA